MADAPAMEFTGERFTPECPREIWYEHWHRYVFALDLIDQRVVLDLACGEGYGADLLARRARSVVGMDSSAAAIAHAAARYRRDNLEFAVGSASRIPAADSSFDAVVSFETIEHLAEQAEMLAEFRRVLRPNGLLIISSPDKASYSDKRGSDNPFHVRELYRDEFLALLRARFPAVRLLGQKLVFQSAIWALDDTASGCYRSATKVGERIDYHRRPNALYLIALCAEADEHLPALAHDLALFADAEESVYAHYYHEIRKNMKAGELLAAKEAEIERLSAARTGAARPWWRRWLGGGAR